MLGDNEYGQLNGTTTDRDISTQTNSGLHTTHIATGEHHTCSILNDGSVNCWGDGLNGQIGDYSNDDRYSPTRTLLPFGKSATSISSEHKFTCVILNDGSVSCWGINTEGQLGDGTTTTSNVPISATLPSGRTATDIAAGLDHVCAIMDDDSLYCWGDNEYGQLGDGTGTDSSTPVAVSLPSGRTTDSITAGQHHTCAILDDASAYCWGNGGYGRLGDGTETNRNSPIAVSLPSGRTASAIDAGKYHTCAIMDDDSLYCWGYNWYGELGDGTNTQSTSPTEVSLPSGRT